MALNDLNTWRIEMSERITIVETRMDGLPAKIESMEQRLSILSTKSAIVFVAITTIMTGLGSLLGAVLVNYFNLKIGK